MEIPKIIYYAKGNDKSKTLSLRELCLREDVEFEAIFNAVKDATDAHDLLERFKRISCDQIEFDCETSEYIRFTVVDVNGNTNHLKFKRKRRTENE